MAIVAFSVIAGVILIGFAILMKVPKENAKAMMRDVSQMKNADVPLLELANRHC